MPPKQPATKEKAKKVKSRSMENPEENVRESTIAIYMRKKIAPKKSPQRKRRFFVCFEK